MTQQIKIFYCNDMENELKSYHNKNRLSKFCMDAGFLNVVEIGQYFMTKDTVEFSQFKYAVACREYTLPRDEESTDPKGWIRGNTKYGVEIRIMSMNRQFSLLGHNFSWPKQVGDEFEQQ